MGIEYLLSTRAQRRGRLGERPLLEALAAAGCDRARLEALDRWPGRALCTLPHELWPSLVLRRVNHLKLVYEGQTVSAVKAYLSVCHAFRSRRAAPGLYR
jgi:hypothetical protein